MTTNKQVSDVSRDSMRSAVSILKRGWLVILVSALICGGLGLLISLLQNPTYRSTATLYVTSGAESTVQSALQGQAASQQRVTSYTKLVDSDAVVTGALGAGGVDLSMAEAKSALSASATPESVLLNVSAESGNRETAAALANAVATSMTSYVARLETPSGGGSPLAKLTVVTPAAAESDPIAPRTERNTALALLVGLLVGIAVVFMRERYNNRVRTEVDIAEITDVPVLSTVPSDDVLKKQGLIDFGHGATLAAEAYRKLRTNLSFTNIDNPPRRILITSALPAEGKTTSAMNLAAALAETGNRVVLVDADLRRPQVDFRSGSTSDVGFTNYLKGDGSLVDLLQPSELEGLQILGSGPQPPNPAELLASKKAGSAIDELSSLFDFVIVDSPPLLPVTDAAVLAQWVDGVLLVVRANQTRLPEVAASVDQLSVVKTPLIGVILTDVPTRGGAYKYGYYYSSSDVMKKPSMFSRFKKQRAHQNIEEVLEPVSTVSRVR